MIYVRRDAKEIPEKILLVAERAQAELESLPALERRAFILRKAHIWRAFARFLRKMSYGKCWYTESLEPHSFLDVDHYRPKLEARRSDKEFEEGYQWLAFSWDNFRLSAQRSNRPNKDEDTDRIAGKGSWFPLLDGSPRACWENRCESTERPILLDPTKKQDVRLLEVDADGRIGPSRFCIGSDRLRVSRSIELYGLNLPLLKAARMKMMREIVALTDILLSTVAAGNKVAASADDLPVEQQMRLIAEKTAASAPYSKAARAQLRLRGLSELCEQPEEA